MLRLATIALVIIVALLRGGSLRNFASIQLRWLPLVIVSFVLQILIFTPFARTPLVAFATLPIYVLSLSLLAIWVAANWRIPGMALIAIGLVLNVVVIAANGGHMPVLPEAARLAGQYEAIAADDPSTSKHALLPAEQARLWMLSDIIAIPQGVPGAVVWSIGDIVLTVGIAILCYATLLRTPAPAASRAAPAASSVDNVGGRGP
ncbi:MAG TPA: DUF5317 domain-containing protein [Roseiflexaceae bacterium]|nr:DUF5317 domain-containing protein [Roseiflexaceae bacterium]